jgi:hypothetical protein
MCATFDIETAALATSAQNKITMRHLNAFSFIAHSLDRGLAG